MVPSRSTTCSGSERRHRAEGALRHEQRVQHRPCSVMAFAWSPCCRPHLRKRPYLPSARFPRMRTTTETSSPVPSQDFSNSFLSFCWAVEPRLVGQGRQGIAPCKDDARPAGEQRGFDREVLPDSGRRPPFLSSTRQLGAKLLRDVACDAATGFSRPGASHRSRRHRPLTMCSIVVSKATPPASTATIAITVVTQNHTLRIGRADSCSRCISTCPANAKPRVTIRRPGFKGSSGDGGRDRD